MAKKKIPEKYLPWIGARKRYHLSDAHIQMARKLGLNPKKFGSLVNTKQEPWKLPLPEFIEELYFKHSKRRRPENVRSIEQIVRARQGCRGNGRGFSCCAERPPSADSKLGRSIRSQIGDIQRMSEYFRRLIIKFFLKQELISARLATSLIN